MRKPARFILGLFVAVLVLVSPATASSGLEGILDSMELRASTDLGSYKADLSLTFGVSSGKVDGLFAIMKACDVYMCLRIGEVSKQPVDRVVEEYKKSKGQGWGVIAKNLGIQPGSDEFHALKEGRLSSHGGSSPSADKGKPAGKGKS
jgi:hypothetical protein